MSISERDISITRKFGGSSLLKARADGRPGRRTWFIERKGGVAKW